MQQSAWDGDIAHAPEVIEGKMQANSEHQKDHTKLGQLLDGLYIAHETRREWTNRNPCQKITDDRWKPDPAGDDPANKRYHERQGNIDQ